ncbi:synaptonemal complex protein 2 [Rhinolophus sinicus]|uniref:synaptonemal complex protein 2 n=1 Tax=Rhinolophus sinicus TaxID=89399 RepID=UPI003D7A81DC
MPIRPDLQQLEKCIDDALRKNDFKPLKTLLQINIYEDVKIKCSKQFLYKLDDLLSRELNKKNIQTVSTILVSFGRCIKNISISGQYGPPALIKQGLVQKMVTWFEKSKEIILSRGNSKDEAVFNMIEDLFDLLMVIYDINDEGKKQIVESFAPRICALVIDSRMNICIQQETLKRMNAMLDQLPQDARKILSSQEMLIFMSNMGERILDAGDYDLQVGIVEALCRMTTENQRQELACQWFSMDFIANAFKRIKDSEFETDCRIFLNLVNGMLGDKRRVFTFPCLSVFLDTYELQIPSDEKLEEFWIDFNLGSQTLSFYIAGDNDDHQWEAVTVPEEEVQIYSIEVRESKKLLTVILKNTVKICNRKGKELLLYFHASLEITKVTQKIFGTDKYRDFTRKQSISVAKTSVHILFDASGSQILVPESQTSLVEEELFSLKEKPNSQREFAKPKPPKYIKNSTHGDRKNSELEIITPSKRKMSEASMIVPGADRYTVRSPILLINTSTPRRGRIKPPLQMMGPAEKPGVSETLANAVALKSRPSEGRSRGDDTDKRIKTANVIEKTDNKDIDFPNQSFNEFQNIVPDLQSVGKIDKPVIPGDFGNVCGNKMHSKWACWTPVTNIKLCENQRTSTSSGDTCNQDTVINKNLTKQKSSSAISDDNSEETGKVEYKKKIMQHKVSTAEVEVCKRNNQQLNHPHSEQESIENTKQSGWHFESETTIKSVLNRVEESVIYRKKYVLSKDVTTAICDENPPRKGAKSHKKSNKRLTSGLHSWDLKPKKMREKSKGNRFTNAAESLISQINKRYKPLGDRPKSARKLKESLIDSGFSNKSDLQFSKEKVRKKSYRQLKTTFVNVTSQCQANDVYNFNLNGADEPIIKLGIQDFQATAREACVDNSITLVGLRSHDEFEPSLRTEDKRIITDHEKKNPFSDTDTEYRYDDSKTDISWLREPKSKPQLVDYSRNKTAKKQKSGKSRSSLERGQPRSKMTPSKNITKDVDKTVPGGRTRLPRRAADTKKNYKDLSNSESESEKEASHSLKETLLVKENTRSRSKTTKLSKKAQDAISTKTRNDISEEWKNSSLLKDATRDNSLDLPPRPSSGGPSSPMPLSGSPSSVEVMRGMEEITERDFTQDYECITKSKSPYPKTSSPESLNSEYGVGGPIKSPKNSEKNLLCTRESRSPVLQSSFLESHSACPLNTSSERREKIRCNMPRNSAHGSGPTPHLSRKRMYIEDNLVNSYEVGLEEEELRANFLARKLSKMEAAAHHTDKGSESVSLLSTNAFSISGENRKSEISRVDMCEEFNTEFRKQLNVRQKLIDYFSKKSLKTAQHHLKTVTHKIQEYRTKKLDKFQFSIIRELENFEEDAQCLKDLEKESVDFWEKTFQKFGTYQKNELGRFHFLKASLDKNVFYSPDREKTICTSEMYFMKENMKKLQAKLLKEMQEEELCNVRKGLLSLFVAPEKC